MLQVGVLRKLMLLLLMNVLPAIGRDLTVCQLLSGLELYKGKTVTVRGQWVGSTGHGSVLKAPSPGCRKPRRTKSLTWSSAIAAIADSTPDFDSLALVEVLLEEKKLKEDDVIILTLVGEIEARLPLEVALSGDGRATLPYGVGHMNRFPALIRYKSMRQPEVHRVAR